MTNNKNKIEEIKRVITHFSRTFFIIKINEKIKPKSENKTINKIKKNPKRDHPNPSQFVFTLPIVVNRTDSIKAEICSMKITFDPSEPELKIPLFIKLKCLCNL